MQSVGFFREMEPGNPMTFSESIKDSLGQRGTYNAEQVATYLESGHPVFDITETTADVVGEKFRVPGGSSVVSDGQYVWRIDLPAYVRSYLIALPSDFLEFMAANRFEIPDVPREQLYQISLRVGEMLDFRADPGAEPRAR